MIRTRMTNCPGCKTELDAATCFHVSANDSGKKSGDHTPEPGDYSVCAHCGQPMRYTKGLRLRAIGTRHLAKLMKKDAQLYLVIDNISTIISHREEW